MLERIVGESQLFLLVAARCFTLIMTLPLFSSKTIPRLAKVALAGYLAYFLYPQLSFTSGLFAPYSPYVSASGQFTLEYILLLAGEALIGAIIGFYITVIFAAFSTAGQFFAFQMGFSASQVYDSMSEVENPLMGQYLNFIAMLVFLQNNWFQELFVKGLMTSFRSINVFSILTHGENLAVFMMESLSRLFYNALVISLPLMGCLFLINICMGILSKAAPQMNLLAEGFPILMLTSFFLLTNLMPVFISFFTSSFVTGFKQIETLFINLSGGGL